MEKSVSQPIWLKLLLAILFSTVLFGQMFRIEVFSGSTGGLLIADGFVLIGLLAGIYLLATRKMTIPFSMPIKWMLGWLVIATISLLINLSGHTLKEDVVGFAYLIRLISYYFLILFGYSVFSAIPKAAVRYLAYLVGILIVLGGIILHVLPDFSILASQGWDPHVNRLTSTWLDPNYFGSFLGLVFAFLLAFAGKVKKQGGYTFVAYVVGMAVIYGAIYLTYSRSALLTFFIASICVAVYMSWRMVVLVIVLVGFTFVLPSRLQGRISDTVAFTKQQTGIQTGSGTGGSSSTPTSSDPTAQARVNSWKRAIEVFKKEPVLGVGYNFYQYEQAENGLISEDAVSKVRGVAGSDSSVLTILATTGLVGCIAFLGFWFFLIREFWSTRKDPYSLGLFGLLIGWMASSFLNNTLLYPLIILPFFILIGIGLSRSRKIT